MACRHRPQSDTHAGREETTRRRDWLRVKPGAGGARGADVDGRATATGVETRRPGRREGRRWDAARAIARRRADRTCAGGGEEAGPSEHAAGKYGSRRKEHVHVRRVSRAVRRPRPPSNSTRGRARRAYLALRCRARRVLTLRALPLRRGVRREWRVAGSSCSSTRRVGGGKEGEEGGGWTRPDAFVAALAGGRPTRRGRAHGREGTAAAAHQRG